MAFSKLIKDGVFRHKGERDLDRAAGFVAKSMKGDALFTWKRQGYVAEYCPVCVDDVGGLWFSSGSVLSRLVNAGLWSCEGVW